MTKSAAICVAALLVLTAVGSTLAEDRVQTVSRFRIKTNDSKTITGRNGQLTSARFVGLGSNSELIDIPVNTVTRIDTCAGTYGAVGLLAGFGVGLVTAVCIGNVPCIHPGRPSEGLHVSTTALIVAPAVGSAVGAIIGFHFRKWRNADRILSSASIGFSGSRFCCRMSWSF